MPVNFLAYQSIIFGLIKREFQTKYTKSLLGHLWVLLNPLYMCLLYTIIFSSVMNNGANRWYYSLYVASGLLIWNFFIEIITRSQTIFLTYAQLIKHQKFPLWCLPIVILGSSWIDFVFSFLVFTVILVIFNSFPGWCYLAILPVIILQSLFAISLATGLGIINLFFRDIEKFTVILLQIWFWLTPIVYFIDKISPVMQKVVALNVLTQFVIAYQTILLQHQWPAWQNLIWPMMVISLQLMFLVNLYARYGYEILDEL